MTNGNGEGITLDDPVLRWTSPTSFLAPYERWIFHRDIIPMMRLWIPHGKPQSSEIFSIKAWLALTYALWKSLWSSTTSLLFYTFFDILFDAIFSLSSSLHPWEVFTSLCSHSRMFVSMTQKAFVSSACGRRALPLGNRLEAHDGPVVCGVLSVPTSKMRTILPSKNRLFSSSNLSLSFHSTIVTSSNTALLIGGPFLKGKEIAESMPHVFHGTMNNRTSSKSSSVKSSFVLLSSRRASQTDPSSLHPSLSSLLLIHLQNTTFSSAFWISTTPPNRV